MRIKQPTPWFALALRLLLVCFQATAANYAFAQQMNAPVTPEVEQLFAQAKAAYHNGDSTSAIEKYRTVIKLAPHLVAAYNNLGMLYFDEHDYNQAVEVLRRCLELDPGMTTASAVLGMSYFHLRQSEKAEPFLRTAFSANPSDNNLEMTLALVLIDLRKDREAATHLERFLERNPKNLDGWSVLRKTYLQMSEDARTRINEIDPDSAIAHDIAGEIDENTQNYTAALIEYRKAIDKAPHQPGTHMHIATAFWHLGEWNSAEAEFKAELANDPDSCTAHWKLADAMLEANSIEDPLSDLNQSIVLCPALMEARVDRARAFIRLGKQGEALPDLLLAEQNRPTEPTIHFLLASVYKALGKTAEAQQEMRSFEQLKRSASESEMHQNQ